MRIAFVSDVYFPDVDGIVIHLSTLVDELARQGHQVQLFVPNKPEAMTHHQDNPNITVIGLPHLVLSKRLRINLGSITPQTIRILREFAPDIVHIQTPVSIGMQLYIAAKILRVPIVGTFHTYFMEPEYLQFLRWQRVVQILSSVLWTLIRWFSNGAAIIITPAKYVMDDLHKHDFRCVTMCYSGIHLPDSVTANKSNHPPKLVYLGRISFEKNIEMLLNAHRLVLEHHPDAELHILGKGPYRVELEKLATQLQIDNRVFFHGHIPHDDLFSNKIMRSAYVGISASESEVFPISLIEMCAVGLPLIIPNRRAMAELIDGNGFLFVPGDTAEFAEKLIFLLDNPDLRNQYANRSVEVSARFSIQNTAQQHIRIYQNVVDKNVATLQNIEKQITP